MSTGLITVMAGYAAGAGIPRRTQLWVEALRRQSQHVVLVFDNDPPAVLPSTWQGADCSVLFERHGAYDFGSYRRGLALAKAHGLLADATHVLLCNDSVVGPLGDLSALLKRMQAEPDQAWGLTASHQLTPHLQSYFVLMGCGVLQHPAVRAFFDQIEPLPSRYAVIRRYELGLSRALLAAGASLKAWVEPGQLLDPRTAEPAGNPTAFPLSLLELGVPVIKARALRERSANQEGIAATCRVIAQQAPELWQALWCESRERRLWQEQVPIRVLLEPKHHRQLSAWLGWLGDQAHPAVQLLLPVQAMERQRMEQLQREQAKAIEGGKLLLLPLDSAGEGARWLMNALMAASADWVCVAADAVFSSPLALSLQAGQIAAQPDLDHTRGQPAVYRREWLLNQSIEVLNNLLCSEG